MEIPSGIDVLYALLFADIQILIANRRTWKTRTRK